MQRNLIKCQDVRWKRPEKRNKPGVAAITAKHPDSHGQISCYGLDATRVMQPKYKRSVSFWGKFASGNRISSTCSDFLKLPYDLGGTTHVLEKE